jgi:peptide/nickel transport system ATP-binding protein
VSLAVQAGEILGLVGESGSGKTALTLSVLGLLRGVPPPSITGVVKVLGTDMISVRDAVKREVRRTALGAVFQDPMTSLNPTMRIGRQLREVTKNMDEAVRLLKAVGVPDPARRLRAFPHELSGGQRQRVMIAMAVAGNPSLVLADEPTTALDVTVQAQVLELIRNLRHEMGCAFVLVTHDLGVAAQVADRIAVMYGGRLMEVGPTAQVLGSPAHPYTMALLRSRLSLGTDRSVPLDTLAGQAPDPRAYPPGCPFAPRCWAHTDDCDAALPLLVSTSQGHAAACVRLSQVRVDSGGGRAEEWPAAPGGPAAQQVVGVREIAKTFVIRSGVRKRDRLEALRGVSIDIRPGECMAVVGESGCGKSTLLRVIAGLLAPDRGEIVGVPPGTAQMVFQEAGASLTPWLTVHEHLAERLMGAHVDRKTIVARVHQALDLVGLHSDLARVKPPQLSGGQRQRVALARAVIIPPTVLLCDEPTSSLDVSLAATVLNLIGRLRRELQLSVLFVTHDLAAARVVADRVSVMYLGQIVESGPVDQVIERPLHPYTKALVAAVPQVHTEEPLRIRGDPGNPLKVPAGCPFHPRCPDAVAACSQETPVLAAMDGIGNRKAACLLLSGGK